MHHPLHTHVYRQVHWNTYVWGNHIQKKSSSCLRQITEGCQWLFTLELGSLPIGGGRSPPYSTERPWISLKLQTACLPTGCLNKCLFVREHMWAPRAKSTICFEHDWPLLYSLPPVEESDEEGGGVGAGRERTESHNLVFSISFFFFLLFVIYGACVSVMCRWTPCTVCMDRSGYVSWAC